MKKKIDQREGRVSEVFERKLSPILRLQRDSTEGLCETVTLSTEGLGQGQGQGQATFSCGCPSSDLCSSPVVGT